MYRGDWRLGDTHDFKFTTVQSTGAPITFAGSPTVAAYPANSTTEITAGITLTIDFDSRTGLHNVRIVATGGNGYATATDYEVVVTAGTINGVTAVGYVVGAFSIENRSAVMPTTAARTLDVSATGEAGVDWANVGSPTTSLALTGTTIAVTQKVDVDTIKTNPVVNGGTITFPTTATLASTTGAVGSVTGAVGSVTGAVGSVTGAVGSVTGAVGSVTGAVGSVTGAVGSVTGAVGSVTGAVGSVASGGIARASFAVDTGLQSSRSNTAQAGAATTITLDASASAVDDFYKNDLIFLTGGTGVGQARFITGYVGATKVATVATWATNPDNTTTFAVLGNGTPTAASVTAGVSVANGGIPAAAFGTGAVDAAALATDAVNEIVAAVFARAFSAAYDSLTFDQIVKVMVSSLAAKLSGAATATVSIRNLADNGDVIVATVDASGNRTAVSRTP